MFVFYAKNDEVISSRECVERTDVKALVCRTMSLARKRLGKGLKLALIWWRKHTGFAGLEQLRCCRIHR